jgi:hypothetical protein
MQIIRVRPNGCIRWKGRELYLGELLKGELVGIDHFVLTYFAVYVGRLAIALIGEETGTIVPHLMAADSLRRLRAQAIS